MMPYFSFSLSGRQTTSIYIHNTLNMTTERFWVTTSQ